MKEKVEPKVSKTDWSNLRPDGTRHRKKKFYCDNCDGCGWYEGGKTIKTTCEKCKGTGIVWL